MKKRTGERLNENGFIGKLYIVLLLIFLFAPIAVIIVFSFNDARSTSVINGISLRSYIKLFNDEDILISLKNSFVLAISATVISTLIGTAAAYGVSRMKSAFLKKAILNATNIPLINPDIITGISLVLLFTFAGHLLRIQEVLCFNTMLIAHVTFCLPYIILSVLPKFRQLDGQLVEAALDLGCSPIRAFLKVELPEILPGVLTGAIMAFTMSLDDFVVGMFTTGTGFQTFPLLLYGVATKKGLQPKHYALSTLVFIVILCLLFVYNMIKTKNERALIRAKKKERRIFNQNNADACKKTKKGSFCTAKATVENEKDQ